MHVDKRLYDFFPKYNYIISIILTIIKTFYFQSTKTLRLTYNTYNDPTTLAFRPIQPRFLFLHHTSRSIDLYTRRFCIPAREILAFLASYIGARYSL